MHMFPDETSKKDVIRWNSNDNAATYTAVAKYANRGYVFRPSDTGYTFPSRRVSLQQKNVSYLDFGTFYEDVLRKDDRPKRTLAKYMTTMRQALEMISWYEGPENTINMSVDKELRKLRDIPSGTNPRQAPNFRELLCTYAIDTEGRISEYLPYSETSVTSARGTRELLLTGAIPMMCAGNPWRCLL